MSKTVLITGSTAGIGRDAALHLARKGQRVIATGRSEAKLKQLEADAAAEGLTLTTMVLDVTDAETIAAAAEETAKIVGADGLDALVNNAGWGLAAPMVEVKDEDLRAQFDTNVFGLMAVTRAFMPLLIKSGDGRLLNVSSVGGRVTLPLFGAYNATKYAVESMSDAMRLELAPLGVKVVLIEPGPIKTSFGDHTLEAVRRYSSPDSPWWPLYERADEIAKQTDARSKEPIVISRLIERAITARRPRARYVGPWEMRVAIALAKALPTRWVDTALKRFAGLTPKVMASSPDGTSTHAA